VVTQQLHDFPLLARNLQEVRNDHLLQQLIQHLETLESKLENPVLLQIVAIWFTAKIHVKIENISLSSCY
jgi:hypothetical protein